jgi:hypothetical protein
VSVATAAAGVQVAPRARFVVTLQDAGASAVAGGVAGGIALGIGSRVAMRLVALTSGQIGTGVRPDSGAVPGTFTVEGTMFLVVAGAMIGAILGLALTFAAVRWLPARPGARILVVTAIGGGLVGRALLDPDNVDFALFGPTWLAVGLFAACSLGYGLLLARLWQRWRTPRSRVGRVGLPVLGALGLALPLFPTLVGLPLVGLAVVGLLILERATKPEGRARWWHAPAVTVGGRILVTAAAVAGGASLVVSAMQILL